MPTSDQAAARLWPLTTTPVDVAASGTRELIASPGEGYAIWVYGLSLSGSAGGTIQLQDDLGTPVEFTGDITLATGIPLVLPISADIWTPWFKCSEDQALDLVVGAGPDVDGLIVWRKVPVAVL